MVARTRRILGVRVDDVTEAEVVQLVRAALDGDTKSQIVTVNTEILMQARLDSELARIIDSCYLALPDGAGILLASRILENPIRERVTGVDFIPRLCQMAAASGARIFFLGAAPGIAQLAADRLAAEIPDLSVAGCHAGCPDPGHDARIVRLINAARPDIILVAYGAPKQEKWIDRNLARTTASVAMGVGGSFDFISRTVPRAPARMRQLGLEWLYRLLRQPWRWRRMLALPHFLVLVFADRVARELRWRRGSERGKHDTGPT